MASLNLSYPSGATAAIALTNVTLSNHDPFVSSMSYSWDLIIGITIVMIVISGLFLNVTVLWTLVKRRAGLRHNHQLTNTDYYIIALASSDLLAVVLCYPLTFVSTLSHRWLFGQVGCSINGFFGFLFSTVDVGVLSTMSIVRMLSVKMPHCALVKQPRYTGVVLIGVLIYALIWTAAPLFGWGVYAPEPFGTSCTVSWKNPDRSYVTAVFTGVLAVPLFIMLVCYGCVVYHMSLSASRVERYFAERKRRAKSQNRLVRMAVIMCVCFLIIWLPYSVLSICFAYIPAFDVHPVQSAIPTVLAKISHVINPVIYFTMNPYYRRRVKCFNCWQSVTSNVSINTGGKMTEECPAERSSDQATQLPLSTYITPSPSMPHNIHAARYNATDRGSPAGSLGAYSDDEADNGTVTLTEVGSVDVHSSVTLKQQHLQDLILTLSKESGGVKNYQEGAKKNSLPNDYPPNNVAKSGSKSLTRLMLVLDKRNFKGVHKESSLNQSETRKLQSNDPDTSKNLLSAQETSGLNTKAGFLSNYNNLAANCGNLNDSEDGDGHLLRDKVRKKLVGVVLSTANGDSSHDSSASSTPEPDSSRSPSARSSDDINSNEISNPKRLVRFMAIHNGVDTATDQNENLETFVLVCPEEIEHLMVDKNSFPTELITNA